MTTEAELINSQITKVLTRAYPPVIMTLEDVAAFVGYSEAHVSKEIVCKPDFPIPERSVSGSPCWLLSEVKQWAFSPSPKDDSPTKIKVDSETQLYRHFNKDGMLLYVGISLSAVHRLASHKYRSHWLHDVARIEIESYSSRTEALHAEKIAIKTENPLFNIIHNNVGDM